MFERSVDSSKCGSERTWAAEPKCRDLETSEKWQRLGSGVWS